MTVAPEVRIGMLGSGFIAEFHTLGLRYVPAARIVANYGAGPERREASIVSSHPNAFQNPNGPWGAAFAGRDH